MIRYRDLDSWLPFKTRRLRMLTGFLMFFGVLFLHVLAGSLSREQLEYLILGLLTLALICICLAFVRD